MTIDFDYSNANDDLVNPLQTALTIGPTSEPITASQIKAQLNITHDSDDELLEEFIAQARTIFENVTQRAVMSQTHKLILNDWPSYNDYIEIPYPPLASVSSITYKDSSGNVSTWGSANYIVNTNFEPGRIALAYGVSWPTMLYPMGGIEITFVAGYSSAALVPGDIRSLIRMIAASLYTDRQNFDLEKGILNTLLEQKKVIWIGNE